MTDKEIIRMLIKQNEKLMTIIDDFAKKSIIINSTVNSYNNPSANVDARDTEIDHNDAPINVGNGSQTI